MRLCGASVCSLRVPPPPEPQSGQAGSQQEKGGRLRDGRCYKLKIGTIEASEEASIGKGKDTAGRVKKGALQEVDCRVNRKAYETSIIKRVVFCPSNGLNEIFFAGKQQRSHYICIAPPAIKGIGVSYCTGNEEGASAIEDTDIV
jgi:hypothetical protein